LIKLLPIASCFLDGKVESQQWVYTSEQHVKKGRKEGSKNFTKIKVDEMQSRRSSIA